jgi:NADH-quinone oxidoreductase subunit C
MTQIPAPADPAALLTEAMPDAVLAVKEFAGQLTIIIPPEEMVNVARFLRDTRGLVYNYLSDISSVDYYPDYDRPGRFGVVAHLYSMLYNRRIAIKTYLQEDDPSLPSLTVLWQSANWLEREIFDVMGITFTDHPDLRRLLLPPDWDGHPLRRDYPLGYETVMFSFNKDEINQHKPYAKE